MTWGFPEASLSQEGLCVAQAEGRSTTFRVWRKERSQTNVEAASVLCPWVRGDRQLSESWMRHRVWIWGGLCPALGWMNKGDFL